MKRPLLAILTCCLTACANTYKAPQGGELVDLEIFTRGLQTRNAFYADETVTIYIENKAPSGTSGSIRLTVEEPRRKTKVMANQPILIRFYKGIPRMGVLLHCAGEVPLTPSPNTSYSIEFRYSLNYENDVTTPCFVEVNSTDLGTLAKSKTKNLLDENAQVFRYKFIVK